MDTDTVIWHLEGRWNIFTRRSWMMVTGHTCLGSWLSNTSPSCVSCDALSCCSSAEESSREIDNHGDWIMRGPRTPAPYIQNIIYIFKFLNFGEWFTEMRTLRPILICPKNSTSQLCPAAVSVDIHTTNIDCLILMQWLTVDSKASVTEFIVLTEELTRMAVLTASNNDGWQHCDIVNS